jgi:uncharacterized membrane protein (DUF2068 family)
MTTRSHHTGLAVIAVFKVMKGLLLLLLGLGLLKLVHAEIATLFSLLIEALDLNADSRLIHALVLKVDALQPHTVLLAGFVSLGYAAMLLAEGVGLWLELTWAAYLTVVSTSLLLPFELYEVIEQVSMLRIGVLLLNLVIVFYLISQLKRHTFRSRTTSPKTGLGRLIESEICQTQRFSPTCHTSGLIDRNI